MIRRYGEPAKPTQKYVLRPGAYAIVYHENSILLTIQHRPFPELQLPGGGIDAGETAKSALLREVREETGWSINAERRLGAFRRFTYMPEYKIWAEKLCHVFLARAVRQIGEPTEPGHEAVWTTFDNASAFLGNDGDRAFVKSWMR